MTATEIHVFPATVLPVPLTAFIGRESDVAAVCALTRESRLLTLTGAGGSGKTRLALASARACAEADSNLHLAWVELADCTQGPEVAPRVALCLGVRAEGGGSLSDAIQAVLLERDVLLVLDNCEHLVDACAALVERLLQGAPRLRVLATSREALGVAGERSWLVPTLTVPDESVVTAEAAATSSAVQLFVERARDVKPGFALTDANASAVVRIVRQLDGLPLAIELAAARTALLTPAQLADRLSDRLALLTGGSRTAPPRQRTLRNAVEWSYGLLADDERLLLDRLSVFVGGFTLEAAEEICGFAPLSPTSVLDVLAALASKSLVAMQEEDAGARYRLLEIIREYATERHRERGEAQALGERHALYFKKFVERGVDELILARRHRLRERDIEHANILAAMAWSAANRRGNDIGLPMVWALQWYWYHRQLWGEGFVQNDAALASADAPTPELRAAALHGLGLYGLHRGHPQASEWLAESDRLFAEVGNERWRAFVMLVRVVAANLRADVHEARRIAEEMLAIAERQPDPWDAALAKAHAMVPVLNFFGEWDKASKLLAEAIEAYRAREYTTGVSYALDAKAFVALQLGDTKRAAELAVESLRNEWDNENRWLAGRNLRILATIAERAGDYERAALLFAVTEIWYEAVGASSLSGERAVVNELPKRLEAVMSAERLHAARTTARTLSCMQAMWLAIEGVPIAAAPVTKAVPPAQSPSEAALEVKALGRLEIRLHGRTLEEGDWPYAKPRELLLYLLSYPEGRTREQIGLAFWPEHAAAQVKNSFHVTLHHLRKTLGDGDWIRYAGGRYVVNRDVMRYDVAEFCTAVEKALPKLQRDADDAKALASLERALTMYTGPFLEEEGAGDWHLELRDRLARLHEDALLAVAEVHGVAGRYADAADRFRRVLELDPLHEDAVRQLMLTLARDERRSDALRVYERLVQDLERELGAVPSVSLRKTAEAIRVGERV